MISAESHDSHRGKWMALLAALLGWLFDGFEIGLFPLVGHHALAELLGPQIASNPAVKDQWFGVIMSVFLVGAATGGVLFGWLGDRIGRVRAMSLSIFTYAVFTGLCGFATEAWHIAVLRFLASLGMGGEWSLGVALVIEIWPDRSRAFLAGLIGAAANVGMLLVGLLSLVLVQFIDRLRESMTAIGVAERVTDYLLAGEGWRLLMITGALPAFLIFFIRLFVPESKKWKSEHDKGTTSLWATRDLIGVLIGACGAAAVITIWSPLYLQIVQSLGGQGDEITTLPRILRIVGTIIGLVITLLGYIYPVLRYLGRAEQHGQISPSERRTYIFRMLLGAALAGVALLGTWGSLQWAPKWAIALAAQLPAEGGPYHAKEYTQIALASGAIVGTIAAALIAGWIGRRITYALLCLLSFITLVAMYQGNQAFNSTMLTCAFLAGGATAAFYGWFPLYFPELFPTSIRATSQGFAYNFGRVLSAIGSLQTAALTTLFAHGVAQDRIEIDAFPNAGATLAGVYIIGIVIIWLGPETKGKPLSA